MPSTIIHGRNIITSSEASTKTDSGQNRNNRKIIKKTVINRQARNARLLVPVSLKILKYEEENKDLYIELGRTEIKATQLDNIKKLNIRSYTRTNRGRHGKHRKSTRKLITNVKIRKPFCRNVRAFNIILNGITALLNSRYIYGTH